MVDQRTNVGIAGRPVNTGDKLDRALNIELKPKHLKVEISDAEMLKIGDSDVTLYERANTGFTLEHRVDPVVWAVKVGYGRRLTNLSFSKNEHMRMVRFEVLMDRVQVGTETADITKVGVKMRVGRNHRADVK